MKFAKIHTIKYLKLDDLVQVSSFMYLLDIKKQF